MKNNPPPNNNNNNPFDSCVTHRASPMASDSPGYTPSRSPIHVSTAYACDSPQMADSILGGNHPGFAYQRDGHPNAETLKAICSRLHQGNCEEPIMSTITSSGMAAMTLAVAGNLESGDHVLLSNRMYGKTIFLVSNEFRRFGIESSTADMCDLNSVASKCTPRTRMLVTETISNPQLRLVDLPALADIAHENDAQLLVDNTFATPVVCRPFDFGADLVLESITKFMNGHGDLMLGLLAAKESRWQKPRTANSNLDGVSSAWGLAASPFDCWLAERGISTLAVRMKTASDNADQIAKYLDSMIEADDSPGNQPNQRYVSKVIYPGIESSSDFSIGKKLFQQLDSRTCFANMLTIELSGGAPAAEKFIRHSPIAFCPSLGECSTTLSHPASTSHRHLSDAERAGLGISSGTIRLSIGLESTEYLKTAIQQGLEGLDG